MNDGLGEIAAECRRLRQELSHTVEPGARAALVADIGEWRRLHTAEAETMRDRVSEGYRRERAAWFGDPPDENAAPQEEYAQTREAKCYRAGQIAFLLLELICAACLAASTLNGGLVLTTIVGSLLAFLVASATSAIVSRWVRYGAEVQPTKQMHRITRGLVGLGGIWLLACVAALTVVRGPEGVIGPWIFWISMALITLLTPVLSSLCRVAADVLSWSRICRRLDAIRALLRELELLSSACERSLTPSLVRRVAKVSAAGLVLVLVGGATCRAADLPVNVYVDVSPSARAGEVTQVLKNLVLALSGYEGGETLDVSIIPFFENAFMATAFAEARIPGYQIGECSMVSSELVSLSRGYADTQKRKCDQVRLQARNKVPRSAPRKSRSFRMLSFAWPS